MKEKFHVIVISASNTFHAQHLAHYCNFMLHYVAGLYINVHVYHCICGCTLSDTLQCCCDCYWNAAACLKRFFSAFGHVGGTFSDHVDCAETLLPTALHNVLHKCYLYAVFTAPKQLHSIVVELRCSDAARERDWNAAASQKHFSSAYLRSGSGCAEIMLLPALLTCCQCSAKAA